MAGTKLAREERVPTVVIAELAHGDRALMSRARRFKSPLRNYLHPLKAAERSGALHQLAAFGPEAEVPDIGKVNGMAWRSCRIHACWRT
jgi:hypothetical protein